MSHAKLKIGLGQIPVIMGDKRANVAAVIDMIIKAAAARCKVIALPECCLAGWLSPKAHDFAEPIPGPFTRKLCSLARHYRIAIVVGMEERVNGSVFNTALFIDDAGRVLLKHRKINELELARSVYHTGTSLQVAPWRDRTIGLSICADSWGPEITSALWVMGAGLIFSPCAWAVEPGGEETNLSWIIETYQQRIGEHDLIIAAPNGVGDVTDGPWKGRLLQGNSLLLGPGGKVLARGGDYAPELICWELP